MFFVSMSWLKVKCNEFYAHIVDQQPGLSMPGQTQGKLPYGSVPPLRAHDPLPMKQNHNYTQLHKSTVFYSVKFSKPVT